MRPATNIFSDNGSTTDSVIPVKKIDDGLLIENTAQLVLRASLLASNRSGAPLLPSSALSSSNPTTEVSSIQQEWIQFMVDNPLEEEHLYNLMNRMAEMFVQQPTDDPDSILEIVLVGPLLDKKHFRNLIRYFLDEFERSAMLRVDILLGLVQMVQDAPANFLKPDDMTRILRSVRKHLEDSDQKDTEDTIYLILAATVLLSTTTADLNLNLQHEPLLKIFSTLKQHKDPLIKVQAKYASQTLLSTPRQSTADGSDDIDGSRGIIKQLKAVLGSSGQQQWFQDVQKAEGYVREHLFSDLKKLICEGPSYDINFQWHAC